MYREYLQKEGYAKTTITSYLRYQSFFSNWCEYKDYEETTIDYKSCLSYIKFIQQSKKVKTITKSTVQHQVGALKIYFYYLVDSEQRFDNPIENINIRGVKRTLNHNLLEPEELEDLYYSYQTENIEFPNSKSVAIRNKVITGLMVYQGLNATALKALKVEHIQLEKGTVYIPSTRKTNSRTLELKSAQILPCVLFIEKHREILQEELKNYTESLFPLNSERFDIITTHLFKRLKRINHKVTNVKQIRASVITNWLKTYNIREVQYMAGHRYISSTERYQQDDLENLHEMIENLHPIS